MTTVRIRKLPYLYLDYKPITKGIDDSQVLISGLETSSNNTIGTH